MPPRATDRALRQLVAELASADPTDVEAVLDGLSAERRARVKVLLSDYLSPQATPVQRASIPDTGDLSPWLAARVEAASRPHGLDGLVRGETPRTSSATSLGGGRFSLTAEAAAALGDAARRMASPRPVKADAPATAPMAWLRRLAGGASRASGGRGAG